MILEALQSEALTRAGNAKVADVRVGLGYTAVLLDNGHMGLAYSFRGEGESGCSVFQGRRPIAGSSVRDVLAYVSSSAAQIERSVGVAAANALLNTSGAVGALSGWNASAGDLLDVLHLTKEDAVGMIGFFGPLVPDIKKRAGTLTIIEENMHRADGLAPADSAGDILPSCSVVIITATSLINNTFDTIARQASSCRVKAVLGPSTPLCPAVFARHGITHLSGIVVRDPQEILRVVSEAGGTKFFIKFTSKLNLVRE